MTTFTNSEYIAFTYRNAVRGRLSHSHNVTCIVNLMKYMDVCVCVWFLRYACRQTDKQKMQTDTLITMLCCIN